MDDTLKYKTVQAAIDDAFIQKQEKFIYEDEVGYDDSYCCDDCQGQATHFLKG